jgi:hypothetical protein
MRIPVLPRLLFLLLAAATLPAGEAETAVRRVRAHDNFLADDLMEGRGTGARGHELAGRYVRAEFMRLGIEPGADGGYEQPIKFIESTSNREAGRLVVRAGDKEDALTPINDMFVAVAPGETKVEVTAPAVFVGFGVAAPELGCDDFAGVDLKGKIAVVLSGAPRRFPSEQRATCSRAPAPSGSSRSPRRATRRASPGRSSSPKGVSPACA